MMRFYEIKKDILPFHHASNRLRKHKKQYVVWWCITLCCWACAYIFNLLDNLFVVSYPQSKQEIHRRSARLRSTKYKAPASEKKVSTKGKGRRHIFKLKNVREKWPSLVHLLSSSALWIFVFDHSACVFVWSLSSADQSTRICCNNHHVWISLL